MLTRPTLAALALSATAVVAIGCGGEADFPNDPRPAVPIELSGVVNERAASVQPAKIGAGPVVLLVSNQTSESLSLSLEGEGITPSEVGPINPEDTATIKKDLPEGTYDLEVLAGEGDSNPDIRAAEIVVNGERPSGADTLLLP